MKRFFLIITIVVLTFASSFSGWNEVEEEENETHRVDIKAESRTIEKINVENEKVHEEIELERKVEIKEEEYKVENKVKEKAKEEFSKVTDVIEEKNEQKFKAEGDKEVKAVEEKAKVKEEVKKKQDEKAKEEVKLEEKNKKKPIVIEKEVVEEIEKKENYTDLETEKRIKVCVPIYGEMYTEYWIKVGDSVIWSGTDYDAQQEYVDNLSNEDFSKATYGSRGNQDIIGYDTYMLSEEEFEGLDKENMKNWVIEMQ